MWNFTPSRKPASARLGEVPLPQPLLCQIYILTTEYREHLPGCPLLGIVKADESLALHWGPASRQLGHAPLGCTEWQAEEGRTKGGKNHREKHILLILPCVLLPGRSALLLSRASSALQEGGPAGNTWHATLSPGAGAAWSERVSPQRAYRWPPAARLMPEERATSCIVLLWNPQGPG